MTQMRRVRSMVCILVAVTLVLTPFGATLEASEADGRFIVIYVDGTDLNLQKLLLTSLGVEVTHVLSLINALAINIPLDLVGYVLGLLLSDPAVVDVYDDIVGSAAQVSPITMANTSADSSAEWWDWGAVHIGVPNVQQQQPKPNGAGVVVAVLDTGIDCAHPELQANIVPYRGFSAFRGEDPCTDNNSHGTHVSGIIAARLNQQGIIGIAPSAKLAPVKVLNHDGKAFCSDVIAGLQWVQSKGILAANMSFGFRENCIPLQKAVERLSEKKLIMVASAGNCGWGDEGGDGDGGEPPSGVCDGSSPDNFEMTVPAAYPEVIAVAASTIEDKMAYYSREGDVDATAPGGTNASEPILSTASGGGYVLKSGTSMAAAHLTAAVALLLQRKSNYSSAQVRSLLRSTASPLIDPSTNQPYPSNVQGAGLIDVEKMLQELK